MSKFSKYLAGAMVVLGLSAAANANINLQLVMGELNGVPSTNGFSVYLTDDSATDFGLASYNFGLKNFLTINNNRAPTVTYRDTIPDEFDETLPDLLGGFTLNKSVANQAQVTGSLDTTSGAAYIFPGFGKTSGNLRNIPSDLAGMYDSVNASVPTSGVYAAKLYLVSGTFTVGTPVEFDMSLEWGFNVLLNDVHGIVPQGGVATAEATYTTGDPSGIPEPASLGVLALGGLALLARRRK